VHHERLQHSPFRRHQGGVGDFVEKTPRRLWPAGRLTTAAALMAVRFPLSTRSGRLSAALTRWASIGYARVHEEQHQTNEQGLGRTTDRPHAWNDDTHSPAHRWSSEHGALLIAPSCSCHTGLDSCDLVGGNPVPSSSVSDLQCEGKEVSDCRGGCSFPSRDDTP